MNYSFDQENRITGANGYAYVYDADGNRVRKSNGTLAANGTLYWYMTPGIVAESDLAGTTTSEYVFFDGERVARRDGVNGAGGVFYYFSDHLKTASVITDAAGTIKAESDYYLWGGELQFTNNDSNHYKFTGKERDTETGLDYFGARYYSNGLARWVSADWSPTPIPVPYADFGDPQSLNLYQFVGGNPASKADPNGHLPILFPDQIAQAGALFMQLLHAMNDFAGTHQTPHMGPHGPLTPPSCGCNVSPNNNQQDKKQNNNNSQRTSQSESGGQSTPKRSEAFNNAKRDARVPTSQQPDSTTKAPLTDANGKPQIDPSTNQPIQTREYTYTNSEGEKVVIQDHSEGHTFSDGESTDPHFNVRPPDDLRHGTVPGTDPHYPYQPRE